MHEFGFEENALPIMSKVLFEFGEVVEHEPCLAQPELCPTPQTLLPVSHATPSFLAKEASAYDVDWYTLWNWIVLTH